MKMNTRLVVGVSASLLLMGAQSAFAACSDVTRTKLLEAMDHAAAETTGGYNLKMWASMVDEAGTVCHVATTGTEGAKAGNSAWLGSRVISAQKAYTANAFSLDGYVISTANLYSAVQPGGSLYGLQMSNPVDPTIAYQGSPNNFGKNNDPMKGKRAGGINVFGGGLALYKLNKKVGAIGVSGDTSCRDHAFAWHVREYLAMHPTAPTVGITTYNVNGDGVEQADLTGAAKGDEMIIKNDNAESGKEYWNAWAQPGCPNYSGAATTDNGTLTIPSAPN